MNILCKDIDRVERQLLDCALGLQNLYHNGHRTKVIYRLGLADQVEIDIYTSEDDLMFLVPDRRYYISLRKKDAEEKARQVIEEMESLYMKWSKEA